MARKCGICKNWAGSNEPVISGGIVHCQSCADKRVVHAPLADQGEQGLALVGGVWHCECQAAGCNEVFLSLNGRSKLCGKHR